MTFHPTLTIFFAYLVFCFVFEVDAKMAKSIALVMLIMLLCEVMQDMYWIWAQFEHNGRKLVYSEQKKCALNMHPMWLLVVDVNAVLNFLQNIIIYILLM